MAGVAQTQRDLREIALPNSTLLPKWRAARARVLAGTGFGRIVGVGDSTEIGLDNTETPRWPNRSRQEAQMLTARGIKANDNGISGDNVNGGSGGYRHAKDDRISSWTMPGSSFYTLGGRTFSGSSVGQGFVYTPKFAVNTAKILMVKTGGGGSITATLGDGTPVVTSLNGAGLISVTVTSATVGLNALTLSISTAGVCTILAITEMYDSNTPSINICNAGWWGSKTADWASTTYAFSPLPVIQNLSSTTDLFIFTPGINDWGTSVDLPTYQANVATLVAGMKSGGADVLLCGTTPNTTQPALQASYMSWIPGWCDANGIAYLPNYERWVSYGVSNALGYYQDGYHPTAVGYADQAAAIVDFLMSV